MRFKRGSAYIEILLSIGIMMVFILPTYRLFIDIYTSQIETNQLYIAQTIVSEVMDDHRTKSAIDLSPGQYTNTTAKLPAGQVIVTIVDRSDSNTAYLAQVTARVVWQGVHHQRNLDVSTFIYR